MPRFRLTIEYDGGDFVGWQRQANGLAIQEVVEEAVQAFSGEDCTVIGAGRTDAGVHACAMVAHVDLATARFGAETIRNALNFHLKPYPIVVRDAAEAAPDFHARFSATRRRYLYRILNRPAPPALERARVWFVPRRLAVDRMADAAEAFVGRHDFSSFRAAGCQAMSPEKTLDRLEVARCGDEVHIVAEARSFLHNQVRIMVGSVKRVGEGKWQRRDIEQALAACDRAAAGPTAPAHGLYLVEVGYD